MSEIMGSDSECLQTSELRGKQNSNVILMFSELHETI